MKIQRISIYKADIPLLKPFRTALGQTSIAKNIFVKIETDTHLFGIGEGSPFTPVVGETQASAFVTAQDMGKRLLKRDSTDIEGAIRLLKSFISNCKTTLSAYDMALYDLLGKAAGLPLYALLAGEKRTLFTDRTVSLDSADIMAQEAKHFKDIGVCAIKVKLGTTPREDIERMKAIREAIGYDLPVRIDANQGWDRISAIQALHGMRDFGIQYCEQPVAAWDHDSMAHIASLSDIPIMADESLFNEHDAYRLMSRASCDCFNIKLAKSGGIHTALKINAIAEATGTWCMIGCMSETRLGLTASAHLASARSNIRQIDLDSAYMLKTDPVIGGMTYGGGGTITLPDTPGLGAEIDPDFLSALEVFVVE